MLEVQSGLDADTLLMAEIKAASKEESLNLLALNLMVRFYVYRVKGTCCLPMFMG